MNFRQSVRPWLLYAVAAFIAVAVSYLALIETRGRSLDVQLIGSISALVFILVMARFSGLITRVQRTKARLSEAEGKYRTLVEQIPAIVYTCEVSGRRRYVSPYIEAMYGFTPAEWLSQPELWLERYA